MYPVRRFPDFLLSPLANDANSILVPTPPTAKMTLKHLLQLPKPTPANPVNHPAPMASFGNHFAAAQATLKQVPPCYSEECGLRLYLACQALAKSCVRCWADGIEYHSHGLADCTLNKANKVHTEWRIWSKSLRLPAGCCFFCGCPLQVGRRRLAHHPGLLSP